MTLLGNLPQSYSTLVTALEVRANDNLRLLPVQQPLIQEGIKLNSRLKQSAMVGAQGGRPWKPRYSCGQTAHLRRDCPKRKAYTTKPQHSTTESSSPDHDSSHNVGAFSASVGPAG